MQTHDDKDSQFFNQLSARADRMREEKASLITAGEAGEATIATWESHGIHCTIRPNDPQNILRISVGGGSTPVPLNYCVIRGGVGECIELLEKAISALKACPE